MIIIFDLFDTKVMQPLVNNMNGSPGRLNADKSGKLDKIEKKSKSKGKAGSDSDDGFEVIQEDDYDFEMKNLMDVFGQIQVAAVDDE